jgi:putative peptidoglycan binding protein
MAEWHTVEQGECLSSLAAQHRLPSWRKIYDHPENADFRRLRHNPNLIHPGDRVYIPDAEVVDHDRPTDRKHRFVLKRDQTMLRIVIADEDGNPYRGNDYRLTIGDRVYEGKTNGQGLLEQAIDARASSGTLTVSWRGTPWRHCTWTLSIGHLDPVEQMSGIQARLNNLGYHSGPVDGIRGPITTGAVKRFQTKHKLTVDGIPGPITRRKLKECHGC